MKATLILLVFLSFSASACAQTITRAQQLIRTGEDSLQNGFNESRTVLSGYGSAYYQRDFNEQKGTASLERVVLFVGHQFNRKWAFFSELELENARVEGGSPAGEIAFEQAYLRYNISPRQYVVGGLFTPRIGLLNENHLPVNFNGVERPQVEQLVIPATWRELGVGWYGAFNRLQLSVAVLNGLKGSGMEHGTGIREGRAEGFFAPANDLAFTAAAVYTIGGFRLQASGYVGGTTDIGPRAADSLGLNGGALGNAVYLAEADAQWSHGPLSAKILATEISFPEAGAVNAAYGKNLPEELQGFYAEAGVDLLHVRSLKKGSPAKLVLFGRFEYLDLNSSIPAPPRGIEDGTLQQRHILAGITFLPIPNISLKADVRLLYTGEQNRDLIINPAPNARPYQQNNSFINVGIGYSF